MGVDGHILTWNRIEPKYVAAVRDTSAMGLGLYASLALYNAIVHAQLFCRAQIQPLSQQMAALDTWALQKLSNGPYNAVTANLLRNSKRFMKAKIEAMDIFVTLRTAPACTAIKKRAILQSCFDTLHEPIDNFDHDERSIAHPSLVYANLSYAKHSVVKCVGDALAHVRNTEFCTMVRNRTLPLSTPLMKSTKSPSQKSLLRN